MLDKLIDGCEHFYWHEALWVNQWKVHVYPTYLQKKEIIKVAKAMEKIRTIFGGKPIIVTSWLRPKVYNELIGGADQSMHVLGGAVDFQVKGFTCDWVRKTLSRELLQLGIRLEDLPGSNWVHIDTKQIKSGARYFKP